MRRRQRLLAVASAVSAPLRAHVECFVGGRVARLPAVSRLSLRRCVAHIPCSVMRRSTAACHTYAKLKCVKQKGGAHMRRVPLRPGHLLAPRATADCLNAHVAHGDNATSFLSYNVPAAWLPAPRPPCRLARRENGLLGLSGGTTCLSLLMPPGRPRPAAPPHCFHTRAVRHMPRFKHTPQNVWHAPPPHPAPLTVPPKLPPGGPTATLPPTTRTHTHTHIPARIFCSSRAYW